MSLRSSPVPAWKVLALLAGAAVVSVVVLVVAVEIIEAHRWHQMRLRLSELRAGWPRCSARHRIPRGPVLEGDAWPEYNRALRTALFPDDFKPVQTFVLRGKADDLEAVRKTVSAHLPALDSLAIGARKARIGGWGQLPPVPGVGFTTQYGPLADLSVARSRLLSMQGRHRLAAEPLLDFIRMMLDGVEEGPSPQPAWLELAIPLHELKLLSASAPMSADELSSLEADLAQLDEGFPCYDVGMRKVLLENGEFTEALPSLESIPHNPNDVLARTGFALFPKLMKADAFLTLYQAAMEVERLHEGNYLELRRFYDDTFVDVAGSRNPILSGLAGAMKGVGTDVRERHAQIRLARMAVTYRATGQVVELRDPWGSVLAHEKREKTIKFWSRPDSNSYVNLRPPGWIPRDEQPSDRSYLFTIEVKR